MVVYSTDSLYNLWYGAQTSVGGWLLLISGMYQKMFAAIKVSNFQPLAKFAQLMTHKH